MFNLIEEEDEEEVTFDNDFGTKRHECLAIVLRNGARVLGITLFRKDRSIEYFWEKMPNCCLQASGQQRKRIHQFVLKTPKSRPFNASAKVTLCSTVVIESFTNDTMNILVNPK